LHFPEELTCEDQVCFKIKLKMLGIEKCQTVLDTSRPEAMKLLEEDSFHNNYSKFLNRLKEQEKKHESLKGQLSYREDLCLPELQTVKLQLPVRKSI
jgi:hypothetical protein